MGLIEQIYQLFDGFQDEACQAWDGYSPDCHPDWKNEVETELNLIKEHSPGPLPEDYCEIFRHFGGGGIKDSRPNSVMPTMTFWTWDEIKEYDAMEGFFADCPNGLLLGDDIGFTAYFYVFDGDDTGIYMAEKSVDFDKKEWFKIASSFTELFTDAELRRLFRNYYNYGCDTGGDGR